MAYYFKRTIESTFKEAIIRIKAALQKEGFGIITEIDIRETFRKKLEEDFQPYTILGACNPAFAFKALGMENKIGTMLPCNVIVQETTPGTIEIAVVDPVVSMQAVANKSLEKMAEEVSSKLRQALDNA